MRQTYTVVLDGPDDEFEVQVDGRDIRAWEAQQAKPYFEEAQSMTKMAQVAHLGAVRHGTFTGDWDTFSARCVECLPKKTVDPTREPEASTPKAPTDAHSASSPSDSGSSQAPSKKKAPK